MPMVLGAAEDCLIRMFRLLLRPKGIETRVFQHEAKAHRLSAQTREILGSLPAQLGVQLIARDRNAVFERVWLEAVPPARVEDLDSHFPAASIRIHKETLPHDCEW